MTLLRGGTETDIQVDGQTWRVHVLTESEVLEVLEPGEVEFLLHSGGGGGGASAAGGGGGAGRRQAGTIMLTEDVAVTIGAGGAPGTAGSASSIGNLVVGTGGGAGGPGGGAGGNGASGGGGGGGAGGGQPAGGTGTVHHDGGSGQNGNATNRAGGGGGGVGGAGGNAAQLLPGAGGPGVASDITGQTVTRGGGGGGGNSSNRGQGGTGGGGQGANDSNNAQPGQPNTGSGGGGAGGSGQAAAGGSGVAIFRYPLEGTSDVELDAVCAITSEASGDLDVDPWVEVERIAADQARVTWHAFPGAQRYIVEHRRPAAEAHASIDPATSPAVVNNVEDGDEIRVGAVLDSGGSAAARLAFDEPTWGDAEHKPPIGLREIVRTSDGQLWLINHVADPDQPVHKRLAVWLWSDFLNDWIIQDWSNSPSSGDSPQQIDAVFTAVGVGVDSADRIHVVTPAGADAVTHWVFDAAFGAWFGFNRLEFPLSSTGEVSRCDLVVDPNDELHLVASAFDDSGIIHELFYVRTVFGEWDEPVLIEDSSSAFFHTPAITVDHFGRAIIGYRHGSDFKVAVVDGGLADVVTIGTAGGANNATRPILFDPDTGEVWAAGADSNGELALIRHDPLEDWDTWDAPVSNGRAASQVNAALHDGKVWLFWQAGSASDPIEADAWDGASWRGRETVVESTGSPLTARPAVRWQPFHLYEDGLEFTYFGGVRPVHVAYTPGEPPAETILWSPWIEVPEWTGGDVVDLAGVCSITTEASVGVEVDRALDGTSETTSGAAGALDVDRALAGAADLTVEVSGELEIVEPDTVDLAAVCAITTTGAGVVDVDRALDGVAEAVTAAAGALQRDVALAGVCEIVTDASGRLTVPVVRVDVDFTVTIDAPTLRHAVDLGSPANQWAAELVDRWALADPEVRRPADVGGAEVREPVAVAAPADRWHLEAVDRWRFDEPIIDRP